MRFLSLAIASLFVISALGCSKTISIESAHAGATKENIQKACAMYAIHLTLHNFKGPSNKQEMLDFLSSDSEAKRKLERVGIDPTKLEDYVVGRDGEPYEFRWGVESNPLGDAYVICWEQTGVNGKVQVGVSGGRIVETDDEDELEELKKGEYSTGASYGAGQLRAEQEE